MKNRDELEEMAKCAEQVKAMFVVWAASTDSIGNWNSRIATAYYEALEKHINELVKGLNNIINNEYSQPL